MFELILITISLIYLAIRVIIKVRNDEKNKSL